MSTGEDVARFTSLYRQHYSKVLSYSLAHDQCNVAEDITNETFLTVWLKLDEVPEDDPVPWLFGIARRHRLKQRDSGRRAISIADRIRQFGDERDHRSRDTADLVAERDAGLAAFASLSERDAEILILTAWYGLTPAQAARVLGCSSATFFVRLHRARKRLTQALKADKPSPRPVPSGIQTESLEGQH
ncbi:hypothetical protein Acsp03_20100 [Actinomadura sp. NBRC 104412]|uniref:RNA polymerase sigma factor n=1 Tax=Actinomadura sp. NBRC 104412 TaxID=3032203 RepID=UPI0024A04362|nr:sigma-70 family RNA polymerase sigma factor [Actinomadura sp. NBRC 104412]GLZ04544.1 hypothetical protein Acsp03_20100 [Actinomadura sp. NBRC 104412]